MPLLEEAPKNLPSMTFPLFSLFQRSQRPHVKDDGDIHKIKKSEFLNDCIKNQTLLLCQILGWEELWVKATTLTYSNQYRECLIYSMVPKIKYRSCFFVYSAKGLPLSNMTFHRAPSTSQCSADSRAYLNVSSGTFMESMKLCKSLVAATG